MLASSSGPVPACGGRRLDSGEALRLLHQSKTQKQLKQTHARILRSGLAADPTLLTALLRLYSSHGRPDLAAAAFSRFRDPPTIAWNLLVRSLAVGGHPLGALRLYLRMAAAGVPPDKFTFPFVAMVCSSLPDAGKGREIHAVVIKYGFCRDLFVQNALIRLYFACGDSDSGRKVFDGMRVRTVVSWTTLVSGLVACGELPAARAAFEEAPIRNVVTYTAMIDGCVRTGRPDEAFELFQRMQRANVRPNAFTVVALLIACTELGSLQLGRRVHEFARENGDLDRGVYVGTALVDMYSKCGSLEDAVRVFGQMPVRSLATWNAMITSLGVHGRGREAVALFREMEKANTGPDRITFVGVLSACAREGMVEEGCRLFTYMSERYGISPGFEHYRCLIELFGHGDDLDGAIEIVKNLISKLDDGAGQMLLGACRELGSAKLEEVACSRIHDSSCVGLAPGECHCFEWEVG